MPEPDNAPLSTVEPQSHNVDHQVGYARERFSIVWIIPLVAALAAAWLIWSDVISRGSTITISFESAEGLEPGKSHIKHKDADIGLVESVALSKDLSRVIVTARMSKAVSKHLTSGSRFWVVRPRLSAQGISGLGTLISGAYIEFDPGPGEAATTFTGVDEPPLVTTDDPGKTFTLHANQISSISQGTPVYFHGVNVGEVLGYDLSDESGTTQVQIFVHAPHDKLVHQGTKFWNISGFNVSVGSDGLKISTATLGTLISGGIAFDLPPGGELGAPATQNTPFVLYDDANSAADAAYTHKVHFLLHFAGGISGLDVGTAVKISGMKIGDVTDLHLEYDAASDRLTVPVTIEIEPQRMNFMHLPREISPEAQTAAMIRQMVARGMRAELVSSNILTGAKEISLEYIENVPPAKIIYGGQYPELPTSESADMAALMKSSKTLLTNLNRTVEKLQDIMSSPEVARSVKNLDASMANLNKITADASANLGPLLASLRDVANSADQAVSGQSASGGLPETMREMQEAARSVRALADYLDRHPEALLRGKAAEDDR